MICFKLGEFVHQLSQILELFAFYWSFIYVIGRENTCAENDSHCFTYLGVYAPLTTSILIVNDINDEIWIRCHVCGQHYLNLPLRDFPITCLHGI